MTEKEFREFVSEYVIAQEKLNNSILLGCMYCIYSNNCENKKHKPSRCCKQFLSLCFRCEMNGICKECGMKWICKDYVSKENKSDVEFL